MILAAIARGFPRELDSEDVPRGGHALRELEAEALASVPKASAQRWIAARVEAWQAARREGGAR